MPEFTLVERRHSRWVHKFDWIFQRHDVDRLRLVDLVEQRRERSRLAASSSAGHENQARFFPRDFLKNSR